MLNYGKIYLFTNLSTVSVGWPNVSSQNCRACELVSLLIVLKKAGRMQHRLQLKRRPRRRIEVEDITAKMDSKTGKIQEIRGGIKLVFGVERKYCRYIQ